MIPVIHPAPSVRGVQTAPVITEGFMALGVGEVFTVLKEVKVNRESLPMQRVLMTVFGNTGITVCVTQCNGIAAVVSKIYEPWNH